MKAIARWITIGKSDVIELAVPLRKDSSELTQRAGQGFALPLDLGRRLVCTNRPEWRFISVRALNRGYLVHTSRNMRGTVTGYSGSWQVPLSGPEERNAM